MGSSIYVYDSLDEIPNEEVVQLLAGETALNYMIDFLINQLHPMIQNWLCYYSESCSHPESQL